ncbi:MAG: hypothetical protein ACQEXJ_15070 [Myxococcota bacterium]
MKHALFAVAAILLLVPARASAQSDEGGTTEVRLEARGGVTFEAPDWKETRHDEAVAVLERAPDPDADVPFGLLILAVEEGPQDIEDIDWERIKDNIVASSKEAGSALDLKLGDAWDGAEGFEGRRLAGTLTAGEREVAVDMVALVAADVLITVSAIGPQEGSGTGELAERVAGTAKQTAGD